MPPNPFSDGLSLKIRASTADVQAGISRVKDALGDLTQSAASTSTSLQVLQGRADEAGDEITGLGRDANRTGRRLVGLAGKAGITGGALSGMAGAASAANVSFSSLSQTSLLVVLPALTVAATALLSVLFPLAAAAGTAALALGGLGGAIAVGTIAAAVTHTQQLSNTLQHVKENILEAIEPLAEAFAPLLRVIILNLDDVVEETIALTGGFVDFRNELWGVISLILDSLPRALALLYDLGRQALPFVKDFIMFLRSNGENVLRSMIATTREIAPAIMSFVNAFINAVPALTRLGTTVLQMVVPALNTFFDLIRNIGQRAQAAGGGGGGFVVAIGNMLTNAFNNLLLWLKNTGTIRDATSDILGLLASSLGNISSEDTNRAVDAVLSVVAGIFDGVTGALSEEGEGGLGREMGELAGNLMSSFAGALSEYVRSDAFQEDLGQFADAMQTALEESIRGLDIALGDAQLNIAGTDVSVPLGFGTGTSSNLPNLGEMSRSEVEEFATGASSQAGPLITGTERRAIEEQTNFEVVVTVEGDQEIVRETAAEVVDTRERRRGRDIDARGIRQ